MIFGIVISMFILIGPEVGILKAITIKINSYGKVVALLKRGFKELLAYNINKG